MGGKLKETREKADPRGHVTAWTLLTWKSGEKWSFRGAEDRSTGRGRSWVTDRRGTCEHLLGVEWQGNPTDTFAFCSWIIFQYPTIHCSFQAYIYVCLLKRGFDHLKWFEWISVPLTQKSLIWCSIKTKDSLLMWSRLTKIYLKKIFCPYFLNFKYDLKKNPRHCKYHQVVKIIKY